ncbi:hypothetical protein CKM354_000686600 [Cercospora kikuchii]|uniref:Uncharacterized protein n=1 Tax=Cercospora kikuchii TaxID=84275 RepID=A0A9P3FI99_9PEZI|nr:uncharacterized protein CKM354_000686600 [Cercospora kikuchii]GIZ43649.1 hypothetical protein CKM354_000686600 [Cercospora kikuchii]
MASNDETIVSPVTTRAPDLTASIAAVNAQPVELDSTPTSPEKVRRSFRATALEQAETKLTPAEQERLKELAKTRKADPAVMQDIPQIPTAEELEIAEDSKDATDAAGRSSEGTS